jgi:hypothetical protein
VHFEEAINDRVVVQPVGASYKPLGQQVQEGNDAPQDDSCNPHPVA